MRILHTSDWHLGHTLRDLSREAEHEAFLAWLLDRIEQHEVDALLIAGDVFHSANPTAAAQAAYYRFLAEARRRFPMLDIVVIGGNHDSPARLDAPAPLLDAMHVHVVGGLPRRADGAIDAERMVVPLTDADGNITAWVAAVPFLRRSDLPPADREGDPVVEGVRRIYDDVFAAARSRRFLGQALLAMGHCYMVGSSLSETSERAILGGNAHALPASLFPPDCAYAALGHLHLAQDVGRPEVRYSGSPIPLSLAEAHYLHEVVLVEFDGARRTAITPIAIPRTVGMLRVPETAPGPIDAVLSLLRALPPAGEGPPPFVEVRIALERPEAELRRKVEDALAGRHARLVDIVTSRAGSAVALGDAAPGRRLADLDPVDVFAMKYAREHGTAPPSELVAAFRELLDQQRAEEAA
jgi:exonuclease SbcD